MPKDVDAADRAQLLRVAVLFGPPCFIMLSVLWYFLSTKGAIPGWLVPLLVLLNLPLTGGGILLIHRATSGAATGFVRSLLSAGDIPPPRTYPNQEVLIAQGRYAEAADYFRDHLTIEPEDHAARLLLARLLETRLGDDAGAERLYLEVRNAGLPPREAGAATNGLIDLYRRTGRRDRLKMELARYADRYGGTAAGEAAARELKALKAEDSAAGA